MQELILGLHTFRDHTQVEAVSQCDNGFGNGRVLNVCGDVDDEGAIDLNLIKREAS